jgi:hypothetical protein
MTTRTIFLAKLIGLLLLLVAVSMLTQPRTMADTAAGFFHDRPLLFIAAVFTAACGLAMVLLHNRWSGGLLPVVVTILGWLTLLKGALLLLLPAASLIGLFDLLQFGQLVIVYGAVDLVIGLYLTIAGFTRAKGFE